MVAESFGEKHPRPPVHFTNYSVEVEHIPTHEEFKAEIRKVTHNIAHHDKTTNFVTRNFLQNFRVILHIYDCI